MRLLVLPVVLAVVTTVVCGVRPKHDDADEQVLVPTDVLRFILGCQQAAFGTPGGPLPVYHTDIDTDTGTSSQKVTLLDIEQLRQSLRSTVHSEEVLELIIGQLSAAVRGATSDRNKLRHEGLHNFNTTTEECTINNNIEISVPAQEVDDFNDRVQMLIQQNSFLLLEQINTLFTYKLRSLREDFGNMVRERTKKINRKLDAVLKALGTVAPVEEEVEDESPSAASESTTGSSSEVETSTDIPGAAEVDHQSQEVLDTTEPAPSEGTFVEAEGGEEEDNSSTRNSPSRPVGTKTYNRGAPGRRTSFRPPNRGPRPARFENPSSVAIIAIPAVPVPPRNKNPAAAPTLSERSKQRTLRQSFLRRQRKGSSQQQQQQE